MLESDELLEKIQLLENEVENLKKVNEEHIKTHESRELSRRNDIDMYRKASEEMNSLKAIIKKCESCRKLLRDS